MKLDGITTVNKTEEKRLVKANGFSTPFSLQQIISWIYIIIDAMWIFVGFRDFFSKDSQLYVRFTFTKYFKNHFCLSIQALYIVLHAVIISVIVSLGYAATVT